MIELDGLRHLLSFVVACYVVSTAAAIKYGLEMLGELAVLREDNTYIKALAVTCLGLVGGVVVQGLVPELLISLGWVAWWGVWAGLLRMLYGTTWGQSIGVGLAPVVLFWLIF